MRLFGVVGSIRDFAGTSILLGCCRPCSPPPFPFPQKNAPTHPYRFIPPGDRFLLSLLFTWGKPEIRFPPSV